MDEVGADSKRCARCEKVKPLSEFHRDARERDGKDSRCRACWTVLNRARREQTRASVESAGSFVCVKCRETRDAAKLCPSSSGSAIICSFCDNFRHHGLTTSEARELFALQGFECGMCGHPLHEWSGEGRIPFFVDHDHACCGSRGSCGKCVRGFLCRACNTYLGAIKDDPDNAPRFAKTIREYLDDPPMARLRRSRA